MKYVQTDTGFVDVTPWERRIDRAEAVTHYLWGACIALLLGLLYFALKGPGMPPPLSCPNVREAMQLDPTTIRATGSDAQWL